MSAMNPKFRIVFYLSLFLKLSFRVAHNVLQLGEVADFKALNFNLALNFI
jgi:hypothetical protein